MLLSSEYTFIETKIPYSRIHFEIRRSITQLIPADPSSSPEFLFAQIVPKMRSQPLLCFLSHLPVSTRSSITGQVCFTRTPRKYSSRFPLRTVCVQAPAPSFAPTSNPKIPLPEHAEKILSSGLPIVVLKRGKARLFRDSQNPLVYGGAVERIIRPSKPMQLKNADPVAVCDGALSCIGLGFFNEDSMYRVRIMRHCSNLGLPQLPWNIEGEIMEKVKTAVEVRALLGIPNDGTDVYRVINGEGDRLSGLMADMMQGSVVVSTSAIWCEQYKDIIVRAIEEMVPGCEEVIWRRNIERLRQDGFEYEAPPMEERDSDADREVGENDVKVVVEDGVRYAISSYAMTRGQKTGHYVDQRENRAYLRDLLSKKQTKTEVLDLFCYSGGFALNAALAGEHVSVTGIDSSAFAIEMAGKNAELNNVSSQISFVQADVTKYVRSKAEQSIRFDVVILDPPKYAPNAKSLPRAMHKYRSLNEAALRLVKKGGLLVTCSCSAAMTRDRRQFVEIVRNAARMIGKRVSLVHMTGASRDHPVIPEMMESEYLTYCIFAVR